MGHSFSLFDLHKVEGELAAGDQVAADGEEDRHAGNTDQQGQGVVVADDDLAGGGHDQHLDGIGVGHSMRSSSIRNGQYAKVSDG